MTTGLIIADDHPLVRSGLRTILAPHADLEVLGEASTPEILVELIQQRLPDVLVIDYLFAGQDTTELVHEIRASRLPCRILIISRHSETPTFLRLLQAGINGCISKNENRDVLLEAIRAVARGSSYFGQDASKQLASYLQRGEAITQEAYSLTRQEKKILQQAVKGSTNGEIASTMLITERTVEFHMSNVLHKLGAKRRLEAVVKAKTLGLL